MNQPNDAHDTTECDDASTYQPPPMVVGDGYENDPTRFKPGMTWKDVAVYALKWAVAIVVFMAALRIFFTLSESAGALPMLTPAAATGLTASRSCDFNGDGFVTGEDYDAFLAAFRAGSLAADYDGDGFVTGEDYDAFVAAYELAGEWGVFPLAPDAKEFRVSNAAELASARSALVAGRPDHLLLRAGSTFPAIGKMRAGGREGAPLLIGRYGDGPNPVVLCHGGEGGIYWEGGTFTDLAVQGVDFVNVDRAPSTTSTGIKLLCGGARWLLEGCSFTGFGDNIVIQGPEGNPIKGVTVRRCVIADSFEGPGHSQGIYAEWIEGLNLSENVFDHNGWREGTPGAEETIFNHNVYLRQGVTRVVIDSNISANASATGFATNLDVSVTNNLIVNCPVGINVRTMGCTVAGNVIEGGGDIGDAPRGIGIYALSAWTEAPAPPPGPLTIRDNIVHAKRPGTGLETAIRVATQTDTFSQPVTIAGGITFDWPSGGQGGVLIEPPTKGVSDLMTLAGNTDRAEGVAAPGWPHPGRTTAEYAASVGLSPTTDAFIAAARRNRMGAWDPRFTAAAVIRFVREGYGR